MSARQDLFKEQDKGEDIKQSIETSCYHRKHATYQIAFVIHPLGQTKCFELVLVKSFFSACLAIIIGKVKEFQVTYIAQSAIRMILIYISSIIFYAYFEIEIFRTYHTQHRSQHRTDIYNCAESKLIVLVHVKLKVMQCEKNCLSCLTIILSA